MAKHSPYCRNCGEREALVLACQYTGDDLLRAPAFCCDRCAAEWALRLALLSGMHWCPDCWEWHDGAGCQDRFLDALEAQCEGGDGCGSL